jgi:hypothetical protein
MTKSGHGAGDLFVCCAVYDGRNHTKCKTSCIDLQKQSGKTKKDLKNEGK